MSYLVASSSAMLVCIHRIVRLNHGVVDSTTVREACEVRDCVSARAERVRDVNAIAATDFNKNVRRLSMEAAHYAANGTRQVTDRDLYPDHSPAGLFCLT